jgi:hypothetical protein
LYFLYVSTYFVGGRGGVLSSWAGIFLGAARC